MIARVFATATCLSGHPSVRLSQEFLKDSFHYCYFSVLSFGALTLLVG